MYVIIVYWVNNSNIKQSIVQIQIQHNNNSQIRIVNFKESQHHIIQTSAHKQRDNHQLNQQTQRNPNNQQKNKKTQVLKLQLLTQAHTLMQDKILYNLQLTVLSARICRDRNINTSKNSESISSLNFNINTSSEHIPIQLESPADSTPTESFRVANSAQGNANLKTEVSTNGNDNANVNIRLKKIGRSIVIKIGEQSCKIRLFQPKSQATIPHKIYTTAPRSYPFPSVPASLSSQSPSCPQTQSYSPQTYSPERVTIPVVFQQKQNKFQPIKGIVKIFDVFEDQNYDDNQNQIIVAVGVLHVEEILLAKFVSARHKTRQRGQLKDKSSWAGSQNNKNTDQNSFTSVLQKSIGAFIITLQLSLKLIEPQPKTPSPQTPQFPTLTNNIDLAASLGMQPYSFEAEFDFKAESLINHHNSKLHKQNDTHKQPEVQSCIYSNTSEQNSLLLEQQRQQRQKQIELSLQKNRDICQIDQAEDTPNPEPQPEQTPQPSPSPQNQIIHSPPSLQQSGIPDKMGDKFIIDDNQIDMEFELDLEDQLQENIQAGLCGLNAGIDLGRNVRLGDQNSTPNHVFDNINIKVNPNHNLRSPISRNNSNQSYVYSINSNATNNNNNIYGDINSINIGNLNSVNAKSINIKHSSNSNNTLTRNIANMPTNPALKGNLNIQMPNQLNYDNKLAIQMLDIDDAYSHQIVSSYLNIPDPDVNVGQGQPQEQGLVKNVQYDIKMFECNPDASQDSPKKANNIMLGVDIKDNNVPANTSNNQQLNSPMLQIHSQPQIKQQQNPFVPPQTKSQITPSGNPELPRQRNSPPKQLSAPCYNGVEQLKELRRANTFIESPSKKFNQKNSADNQYQCQHENQIGGNQFIDLKGGINFGYSHFEVHSTGSKLEAKAEELKIKNLSQDDPWKRDNDKKYKSLIQRPNYQTQHLFGNQKKQGSNRFAINNSQSSQSSNSIKKVNPSLSPGSAQNQLKQKQRFTLPPQILIGQQVPLMKMPKINHMVSIQKTQRSDLNSHLSHQNDSNKTNRNSSAQSKGMAMQLQLNSNPSQNCLHNLNANVNSNQNPNSNTISNMDIIKNIIALSRVNSGTFSQGTNSHSFNAQSVNLLNSNNLQMSKSASHDNLKNKELNDTKNKLLQKKGNNIIKDKLDCSQSINLNHLVRSKSGDAVQLVESITKNNDEEMMLDHNMTKSSKINRDTNYQPKNFLNTNKNMAQNIKQLRKMIIKAQSGQSHIQMQNQQLGVQPVTTDNYQPYPHWNTYPQPHAQAQNRDLSVSCTSHSSSHPQLLQQYQKSELETLGELLLEQRRRNVQNDKKIQKLQLKIIALKQKYMGIGVQMGEWCQAGLKFLGDVARDTSGNYQLEVSHIKEGNKNSKISRSAYTSSSQTKDQQQKSLQKNQKLVFKYKIKDQIVNQAENNFTNFLRITIANCINNNGINSGYNSRLNSNLTSNNDVLNVNYNYNLTCKTPKSFNQSPKNKSTQVKNKSFIFPDRVVEPEEPDPMLQVQNTKKSRVGTQMSEYSQSQLDKVIQKIQQTYQINQKLLSTNKSLQSRISVLQSSLSQANTQLQHTQTLNSTLRLRLTQFTNQCTFLESQLRSVTDLGNYYKQKDQQMESIITMKENAIQGMKKVMVECNGEIEDLEDEVRNLRGELDNRGLIIEEMKEEIADKDEIIEVYRTKYGDVNRYYGFTNNQHRYLDSQIYKKKQQQRNTSLQQQPSPPKSISYSNSRKKSGSSYLLNAQTENNINTSQQESQIIQNQIIDMELRQSSYKEISVNSNSMGSNMMKKGDQIGCEMADRRLERIQEDVQVDTQPVMSLKQMSQPDIKTEIQDQPQGKSQIQNQFQKEISKKQQSVYKNNKKQSFQSQSEAMRQPFNNLYDSTRIRSNNQNTVQKPLFLSSNLRTQSFRETVSYQDSQRSQKDSDNRNRQKEKERDQQARIYRRGSASSNGNLKQSQESSSNTSDLLKNIILDPSQRQLQKLKQQQVRLVRKQLGRIISRLQQQLRSLQADRPKLPPSPHLSAHSLRRLPKQRQRQKQKQIQTISLHSKTSSNGRSNQFLEVEKERSKIADMERELDKIMSARKSRDERTRQKEREKEMEGQVAEDWRDVNKTL